MDSTTLGLHFLFLISVLILLRSTVDGYSTGAPNSEYVCQTLAPRHGVDAQRGSNPTFRIQAKSSPDGSHVEVTLLASSSPFKGFLIQARDATDTNLLVDGTFLASGESKAINCLTKTENTLTHSSPNFKYQVSTRWYPPQSHSGGPVVFLATVVQEKETFWLAIPSNSVTLQKSYHSVGLADNPTRTENPKYSMVAGYEQCGVSKTCFGLPKDCLDTKSCKMLLYISKDPGDGSIEFEIQADATGSEKWFAVGISDDAKMGGDSVTECLLDDAETVHIQNSWNMVGGYSNEVLERLDGIEKKKLDYTNGRLHCVWNRKEMTKVKGRTFDLKKPHHLLVAYGPIGDREKLQHSAAEPSELAVNFAAIVKLKSSSNNLIKLHGAAMVSAWLGMVSIAIVMARHYKRVWRDETLLGTQIWFTFHRGLMVVSLIFVVVAMVSIFVHIGGWRATSYHPYAGVLANVLMFIQPLMAMFRCSPDHESRWIFNWCHWLVGNIGHISAIAALFLASNLKSFKLPSIYLWLLIGYVVCHVFVHLALQVHSWCLMRSNKVSDSIPMNEMSSLSKSTDIGCDEGECFKQLILGFYVVMISVFALVLVLVIVL